MKVQLLSLLRSAVLTGMALLFGTSCIPVHDDAIRLQQVVRAVPGGSPPWQRLDVASGVRVRRGDAERTVWVGMVLDPGDVLVTGSGFAAVLRLGGQGEAAVDENTAVRIGSLEVLFGRLFANLRGLFVVRGETVEAVNDGTRFLFEVRRDRSVRAVVAEGAVTVHSRTGGWTPLRLTSGRGLVVHPGGQAPQLMPADPFEVDVPLRAITSAPRAGWCCSGVGGQVSPALEDRCSGRWSSSRESAETQCRPPPPPAPLGWCCSGPGGSVGRTTEDRCPGRWSASRESAEAQCAPKPSAGWCCVVGKSVVRVTQDRCPGRWSESRDVAESACASKPAEPMGWCCSMRAKGVVKLTRENCTAEKGRFFSNEEEARKRCVIVQ
jgi:hypothetical protein